MENIENEFNKLQSIFNEGKKYLIGKNKDIKMAIKSYDNYLLELDNLYKNLKTDNKNDNINEINSVYISHLIKLTKIFLLIPYYHKAKLLCEKILELDKDNTEILQSYIKCLHYFRNYKKITEILEGIKNVNDNKIKELKIKNNERIKESNGEYDLKKIFQDFKKNNNYNLDLAQYTSDKISIQKDNTKGLIILATNDIPKGTLIIASKAIECIPKSDKNLVKIYYQKEEYQKKLINKIKDKMIYCKEDIPEIYELYDKTNSELSLEERKQNYIKSLSNGNEKEIPDKNLAGIFSNAIATKLYLYDEFDLVLGLFYYPSFMSHSCVPNTKILGIGDFIFVFTDKLIKKDEEVTTSYVDFNEEYKKRQEKLKKFYGFECQCELCLLEKKKFEQMPEIKNKVSNYINELLDLINNSDYDQKLYLNKANEITKFIEDNNDKINNYEKSVLYFNLFCLWPYNDGYIKNYNLLEKGLECCENEINIQLNIMQYYFLLKMFKINFVFNIKLCVDVRKKMIKLFSGVLGDNNKELAEALLDDLLKFYTSDEDREIKGFKVIMLKELKNKFMK